MLSIKKLNKNALNFLYRFYKLTTTKCSREKLGILSGNWSFSAGVEKELYIVQRVNFGEETEVFSTSQGFENTRVTITVL